MSHTQINLGSGLATLLTGIFVVAKLWGKIDWPWILIFAPIWISFLIAIVIMIIVALVILIGHWRNWF